MPTTPTFCSKCGHRLDPDHTIRFIDEIESVALHPMCALPLLQLIGGLTIMYDRPVAVTA